MYSISWFLLFNIFLFRLSCSWRFFHISWFLFFPSIFSHTPSTDSIKNYSLSSLRCFLDGLAAIALSTFYLSAILNRFISIHYIHSCLSLETILLNILILTVSSVIIEYFIPVPSSSGYFVIISHFTTAFLLTLPHMKSLIFF